MRKYAEDRCVEIGEYMVSTGDTVRGAATHFGISKSTVHTVVVIWNGYL